MLAHAVVAVVVPAFDEERHIAETLRTMPAFVDHVLVVDDASRDATSELARAVGDARVTVLRHARNRGVGAAIVTGYRAARERGAHAVAVMAGDGQMHPDDLEPLVRAALASGGYAKGTRMPWRRPMPALRGLATSVLGRLTGLAVGLSGISDGQCGYTVITGRAIDALEQRLAREGLAPPGRGLDALWPGYGYPNDLLGALARAGVEVREVPVRPVYRGEASGLRARHVALIVGLIVRAALRARARPPDREASEASAASEASEASEASATSEASEASEASDTRTDGPRRVGAQGPERSTIGTSAGARSSTSAPRAASAAPPQAEARSGLPATEAVCQDSPP